MRGPPRLQNPAQARKPSVPSSSRSDLRLPPRPDPRPGPSSGPCPGPGSGPCPGSGPRPRRTPGLGFGSTTGCGPGAFRYALRLRISTTPSKRRAGRRTGRRAVRRGRQPMQNPTQSLRLSVPPCSRSDFCMRRRPAPCPLPVGSGFGWSARLRIGVAPTERRAAVVPPGQLSGVDAHACRTPLKPGGRACHPRPYPTSACAHVRPWADLHVHVRVRGRSPGPGRSGSRFGVAGGVGALRCSGWGGRTGLLRPGP
jgi:hypothetical protein